MKAQVVLVWLMMMLTIATGFSENSFRTSTIRVLKCDITFSNAGLNSDLPSRICLADTLKKKKEKRKVEIKTFLNADKSWGYKILVDGKLYINQTHIPAVPGNKGFASESDAKKCAGVMKKKIEKNIMPPTVEIKDLDSLKIKY
jgi:hypothetical protein